MVPRARGPDLPMPLAPANDRGRNRPVIAGAINARRRGRAAVLRAGRRPGHRQGRGRGHHPGAQRYHRGPPPAGVPDLRHHPARAGVAGRLAGLLGRRQARDGGHRGLLETGVLPAGITRVRLPAVQRRAGQGAARQAQDRPGRLDLASPDHRAGLGLLQLRAARADPPPAHPHPLPPAPHPGSHRREAAGREAARRRAPETVQRDRRHPRRLGPGHAGRDRRRAARPQGPGAAGPRQDALDCSFFTEEHAAVLAMMLAAIDHYFSHDTATTEKIEELAAPYLRQVQQLDAVPGIGQVCAQDIIAEIGTDMTVFPTGAHLVSWAKWSPQVKKSAGKRKGSNATGRGNPYLGAALGEATISAGRTQSFLGAKYRRLTRRMPKKKALVATGNSMLASIHALLSDPDASYQDLGADYYEHRMHVRRQARNHVLGLQRLGYQVTIQAVNPDTGELQAATA